jgi:hypothetical protein
MEMYIRVRVLVVWVWLGGHRGPKKLVMGTENNKKKEPFTPGALPSAGSDHHI